MNCLPLDLFQKILFSEIAWKDKPTRPITGIAVDSRKVHPNDLFFALPGEKTDGHDFIEEAVAKGASALLVQREMASLPLKVGVAQVSNGIMALQQLASSFLKQLGPTLLALTGSLGKTTTKEFTRACLQACGSVASPEGNGNSQIGLALGAIQTLLQEKEAPKWFVAEMGMSEKGNLSQLIRAFPPEVALVTCIAPVHFFNFQSLQEVAEAKAEIFQSPRCKTSLVNIDSDCADVLVRHAKGQAVTMSMKQPAEYMLHVKEDRLHFFCKGTKVELPKPNLCAPHLFENLLHAMALSSEGGADIACFEEAITRLPRLSKRLEFVEKKGILFINDSYNAAEASTVAALHVLSTRTNRRKIAVLGQMKELGPLSKKCHASVGQAAATSCDRLFCLGEECGPLVEAFRSSNKPHCWAGSLEELIHLLKQELKEGDAVLLKGSNSNRLWTILDSFA